MVRKLKGKDIFKVSKIMKKIGLKKEVSALTTYLEEGQSKEDLVMNLGVEFFAMIIENIHMAEKEIFDFLGDLIGMNAEEYSERDLDLIIDDIEALKNSEDIMGFFKKVSRLMNMK